MLAIREPIMAKPTAFMLKRPTSLAVATAPDKLPAKPPSDTPSILDVIQVEMPSDTAAIADINPRRPS
ncbi:hypothetical protein D3C76_1736510 [compost metagenome]